VPIPFGLTHPMPVRTTRRIEEVFGIAIRALTRNDIRCRSAGI
jgi:hypothetical protein